MSALVRQIALASAVCLSAAPLSAHPGHGKDGGSHELTHYFTEPAHLLPLAIAAFVGVAAAGAVIWYRRRA